MYVQQISCPKCGNLTYVNIIDTAGATYSPCSECSARIAVVTTDDGKIHDIYFLRPDPDARPPVFRVLNYTSDRFAQVHCLMDCELDIQISAPIQIRGVDGKIYDVAVGENNLIKTAKDQVIGLKAITASSRIKIMVMKPTDRLGEENIFIIRKA